jgi:hypothetical protein
MGKQGRSLVRVKVLVQETVRPRRQTWQTKLLTTGLVGVLFAAALGGTWLAIRLIVNPGSVGWMSRLVPNWDQSSLVGQAPQTLSEIRVTATAAGFQVGNPIYLSTYPGLSRGETGFDDLLLPIYQPQSYCETNDSLETCQRLVELRAYRPQAAALRLLGGEPGLELLDQLPVGGLEEHFVIAPLVNASIADQGSTRKLPFTSVMFVDSEAPLPGAWFHLSGAWQRGSSRTVYGQIIRYDPVRARLHSIERWTSPAEQFPAWQQVTGQETNLVVNQTIGLEPKFQVYQLAALRSPAKPVQVNLITLAETGLDDRAYKHGLLLARNGLWTLAQQQLEASKAANPSWSTAAQAQLDLVSLHAAITKAQADRDWASPRQQLLALLMDGRWAEALTVLQTAHENGYTLNSLLTDPADRLRQRVETTSRINANSAVQSWGVLLTAIHEDRGKAIEWLKKQPQVVVSDQQMQQLLALLETPSAPVVIAAAASEPVAAAATVATETVEGETLAISAPTAFPSQIIGTAVGQSTVDWAGGLRPDPENTLALSQNQSWYEIQVLQFQDGQRWQSFPFANLPLSEDPTQTARSLWQLLGLTHNAQIHLVSGMNTAQPQITPVTIRAVQWQNGTLNLLAAGDTTSAAVPALAMTLSSLSWQQPAAVLTLTHLNQQYPEWAAVLLPVLWQELQQTGQLLPVSLPNANALLKEFGFWSFQLMDLTGDRQLEGVLTIAMTDFSSTNFSSANSAQTNSAAVSEVATAHANPHAVNHTKTLIFSSQGSLLYSDLNQDAQSLQAIVDLNGDLGSNELPALIIHNGQGYRIEQWSTQHQRFE